MSPFFFLAWIAIAIFLAVKANDRRRRTNEAWRAAAEELGLESEVPGWMQKRILRGRIDGISVELAERRSNKTTYTVFTVRLPAPVPVDLKLSAENLLTQVSARLGAGDLQTGDELFDAAVYVRGEEDEALARLVAPARRALTALVERGAKLESGKLELELRTQVTDASDLIGTMRTLAGAARLFHLDGASVPEALARNAVKDPEAPVRLRNLSVLFRDHPRTEAARQAAAKAVEDLDPAIRLRAAEFLPGAAASPALRALVGSDEAASVRAEALRLLSRKCSYEEIADAVAPALRAPEAPLRLEAVRAVGRGGDHSKIDALVELVDGPPPPLLAEALAEAFGQLGGPRAEEALLRLLAHDSDRVRVLAAEALGTIGTVRAVEPLLPLTRGLLGGELQQAARDAVRHIQGRLGDVDAGRLAVVDDQGGALSLPAEEGGVAVVENAAPTRERSGD